MKKFFMSIMVFFTIVSCKDWSKEINIVGNWGYVNYSNGLKVEDYILITESEEQPKPEVDKDGKPMKIMSKYFSYEWNVFVNGVLQDGKNGAVDVIYDKSHKGRAEVGFKDWSVTFIPIDESKDPITKNFILKYGGDFLQLSEVESKKSLILFKIKGEMK